MIFTRLLSLILRVAQFVFAAVVLGLTAYFIHSRMRHGVGPFGRTIFAIVWSSLSILFSVIWMIPTKSSMASYGSDLRKYLTTTLSHSWLFRCDELTLHNSVHSRLGRRVRTAGHLVQRRRLR
jgi:hypothetical protein